VAISPDGEVYLADSDNRIVSKIGSNGILTIIAGTGARGSAGDGGLAAAASLGG